MASFSYRIRLAFPGLTLAGLWLTIATIPLRWQLLLAARPTDLLYEGYTDFFLTAADLTMVAVVALWFAAWPLHRTPIRFGPLALTAPLAGLLLWSMLTAPLSVDPALSAFHLARMGVLALLFLVAVSEGFGVAAIAPGVALQVILQAYVAFGQWLTQRWLGYVQLGERELNPEWLGISVVLTPAGRLLRAYGLADHPNILGGCFAVSAVLLMAAAWRGPRVWQALYVLVAGLALAGLTLTFSRSAWLGAAGGWALLALWMLLRRDWRRAASLALPPIIGVVLLLPSSGPLGAALSGRFGDTNPAEGTPTTNRSVVERSTLLQATSFLLQSYPLTGVGLGGFPAALLRADPTFPDNFQPVHNVLLEAMTETGIPGGLLYGLALAAPFWLAFRRRWPPAALAGPLAGLLAFLIVGQLDYYPWLFQPGRTWQVLLWALWSAEQCRHVVPRQ